VVPNLAQLHKREYESALKGDEDGVTKARYDLLRMVLFKGLRGEVIKQADIKTFVPTVFPRAQAALMAQVSDTLQDLFGLNLREKYKRKAATKGSSRGSPKKKRKKNQEEEVADEEEDDVPSVRVQGTRDYYVVSELAPPPEVADQNQVMDSKDLEDDVIEQGQLCDTHRHTVGSAAGDVTHATRALLLTTLGLISQGEQDEDGKHFLDENTLLNRVQELFVNNMSSGARASGSIHTKLGNVKDLITTKFKVQDYLQRAVHPNKKLDHDQKILRVYYIGQHAVHEIGMHSLYEWMTKLTNHPKDDSQWKEWGKRDSDAKAYC